MSPHQMLKCLTAMTLSNYYNNIRTLIQIITKVVKLMWLKQCVQVAIFPKKINCINYAFKGGYFFRFSLLQQSASGTKVSAHPKIFQGVQPLHRQKSAISSPTQKKHQSNEHRQQKQNNRPISMSAFHGQTSNEKNSKNKENSQSNSKNEIIVENGVGYFQTKKFNVYYEEFEVELEDMVVFTLQSKFKQKLQQSDGHHLVSAIHLPTSKLYLVIDLYYSKNKLTEDQHGKFYLKSHHKKVSSHKFYLNLCNKSMENDDQFQTLLISDPDHFTQIDTFIGHVHSGWKLRRHKYSLCQFQSLPRSQQLKLCVQAKKNHITQTANKTLMKLLKTSDCTFLMSFYKSTIMRLKHEYQRLFSELKKLNLHLINNKIHENRLQLLGKGINSPQDLEQYFQTPSQDQLYFCILKESYAVSSIVQELWGIYCKRIKTMYPKLFQKYCQSSKIKFGEMWRTITISTNHNIPRPTKLQQFKIQRKSLLKQLSLYSAQCINHPFITVYSDGKIQSFASVERKSNRGTNIMRFSSKLVILVHGYKGSFDDLSMIGSFIKKYCLNTELLYVRTINRSNQDLEEMAAAIATQIKNQLRDYSAYETISFIGYSMGGLIIRAALKHLSEFKQKMKTLITLSSPHIGVFNTCNNFIKLGAWYLSTIEKDKAIEQLWVEADLESSSKTILKKLSLDKGIGWFDKVIVVTSMQDQFVPYYSSAIAKGLREGQAKYLSDNIRKNAKVIQQVQVWFDADSRSKGIDRLTGRQAHVQFLTNSLFVDTFISMYADQL